MDIDTGNKKTTKTTTKTVSIDTSANTNTKSKAEKRKVEEVPDEEDTKKVKKVKASKANTEKVEAITPKKVNDSSKTATDATFIESKKFSGRKVGYAFKLGKQGLGYYIDPVQKNKSPNVKKVHWGGGESKNSKTPSPGASGSSTPSRSALKKTATHKSTPAKRK